MQRSAARSSQTSETNTIPPQEYAIPPKGYYSNLLERLLTIRDLYMSWSDPLSVHLREWSDEGVAFCKSGPGISVNAFEKGLEKRINVLVSEILINPSDDERTLLVSPHLVGTEVWEEEELIPGGTSLRSGIPFSTSKTHDYAVEMLSWLHSIRFQPASPKSKKIEFTLTDEELEKLQQEEEAEKTTLSRDVIRGLEQLETQHAEIARENKACEEAQRILLEEKAKEALELDTSARREAEEHLRKVTNLKNERLALKEELVQLKEEMANLKKQALEKSEKANALLAKQKETEDRLKVVEKKLDKKKDKWCLIA